MTRRLLRALESVLRNGLGKLRHPNRFRKEVTWKTRRDLPKLPGFARAVVRNGCRKVKGAVPSRNAGGYRRRKGGR